uniref:Uncharacterized protein n=2 Tax=Ursus TaxID=9639 RepID=A0A452T7T1_URSMA
PPTSKAKCKSPEGTESRWTLVGTYPPLRVGVRPKSVQSPTDMSSELSTVTTAARASPHLDLTMSILPAGRRGHIRAASPPDPDAPGPFWAYLLGAECALTSENGEDPGLTQAKDSHVYFPVSGKWCVF